MESSVIPLLASPQGAVMQGGECAQPAICSHLLQPARAAKRHFHNSTLLRRPMARKLCFVVALLALIVVMQQTAPAQDAREILQAAVRAMGAANVKTIQYSGTGCNAAVGQSYSPQDDWPHFEVTRYTRTIDYDAKSSREELTRRQG